MKNINISDVRIRRQEKFIDILAFITYEFNGKKEKMLLNIENKFYNNFNSTQLSAAKNYVFSEYSTEYNCIKHLLISIDLERKSWLVDKCKSEQYRFVVIDDFLDKDETKRGNFLFDQFFNKFRGNDYT